MTDEPKNLIDRCWEDTTTILKTGFTQEVFYREVEELAKEYPTISRRDIMSMLTHALSSDLEMKCMKYNVMDEFIQRKKEYEE